MDTVYILHEPSRTGEDVIMEFMSNGERTWRGPFASLESAEEMGRDHAVDHFLNQGIHIDKDWFAISSVGLNVKRADRIVVA